MSSESKETSRVYILDLLRFVAVCMVVLFHYCFRGRFGFTSYAWDPAGVFKYGYLGLNLFFTISGFVIIMTVENRNATQFAISRITRLYPAFWTGCTITFLASLFLGNAMTKVSLTDFLINLTMLPNLVRIPYVDGAYWSLFTEFQFYCLVGVTLLLKQMKHFENILWGWLALCVIGLFKFHYIGGMLWIEDWGSCFISGAVFYIAFKNGWNPARIALAVCAFLLSVKLGMDKTHEMNSTYHSSFSIVPPITFIGLINIIFLMISFKIDFRHSIFYTLGCLTYPLYLIHQNIGYMLFNHLAIRNPFLELLFISTISVLLAIVIHRLFEKPGGKWLKKSLDRSLKQSSSRKTA